MKQLAWCPELNKNVSGEEVWELRYGKVRTNEVLSFFCPDEMCRAKMITRNCLLVRSPYETTFRLYQNDGHEKCCTYAAALRASKQLSQRIQQRIQFIPYYSPSMRAQGL